MSEYEQLSQRLERLRKEKQAPNIEAEIAVIEWELREVKAQRDMKVAQKARLLFRAYQATGKMTAIHPSGQRREGSPYTNVEPAVQRIWNVRSEAENLAQWAVPL